MKTVATLGCLLLFSTLLLAQTNTPVPAEPWDTEAVSTVKQYPGALPEKHSRDFNAPDFLARCDVFTTLSCGQTLLNESTVGAGNDFNYLDYSCQNTAVGWEAADKLYKITIATQTSARFVLDIVTAGKDLDMFLLSVCPFPATCIGFSFEDNITSGITREVLDVNLVPGTYYLVVDGFADVEVGTYNLSLNCTCNCIEPAGDMPAGQKFFCDDFQDYQINKALDPQSTRWDKVVSSNPDAIVEKEATNSNQYARFQHNGTTGPNYYYYLDEKTSGRWRLSWRMRVAPGKKGYYNMLHERPNNPSPPNGTNWAYHVWFEANGSGTLRIGNINSAAAGTFGYPNGQWFNVVQIVDMDKDSAELWINNNFVHKWKFSLGFNGTTAATLKQMSALIFRAGPDAAYANVDYQIDNLCVWTTAPCTPFVNLNITCVENGSRYDNTSLARCDLYTSNEWGDCYTVCDFGGTYIYRGEVFSGKLDNSDFAGGLIKNDPCVVSEYGGLVPEPLYADFYIFDKKDNQIVDVIMNSGNSNTKVFVFSCNYQSGPNCVQQQRCLTETSNGVWSPKPCDSLYYIVVTGTNASTYTVSVVPTGLCPTSIESLPLNCNSVLFESRTANVAATSTFDAVLPVNNYGGFYNGARTYTGGEKFYSLTLDNPGDVEIRLTADDAMGIFVYSAICGEVCLAYAENSPPGNKLAKIKLESLPDGIYYIVVDKALPGGNPAFELVAECLQPKSLFSLPNFTFSCPVKSDDQQKNAVAQYCYGCGLNTDTIQYHQVDVAFNAFSFQEGEDQLHFLFRDTANNVLTSANYLSKFWNPSGANPDTFSLQPDLIFDSIQCSYLEQQLLYMWLLQTNNGQRTYRQMTPTFLTNSLYPDTDKFKSQGRSYVQNFTAGEPVNFYVQPPVVPPFLPANSNQNIKIFTNLDWKVRKLYLGADTTWLTLNKVQGSKTTTINLATQSNNSPFPRSIVLEFSSRNQPEDVYRQYVTVTQQGVCVPANVTVEVGSGPVCAGDSVTLTANPGADLTPLYNYLWSNGETTPDIRILPAAPFTYSVTITNKYCADRTASDDIQLTINPSPNAPTAPVSQTMCEGGVIPSLSVTPPPGAEVDWYTKETGGNLIGTGASFTPGDDTTATYYAEARLPSGCVSATRTPVSLTVNARPGLPTDPNNPAICAGDPSLPLTVVPPADAQIDWYAAASGGPALQTNTTSFTPPPAVITVTYYAEARLPNGCVSLSRVPVTLTVNPRPDAPGSPNNPGICLGEPIPALSVTVTGGALVDWYTEPSGGTPFLTNNTSYTPPTAATVTYYTQAYFPGGCSSTTRTPVTLTVDPKPLPPTDPSNPAICTGAPVPPLSVSVPGGQTVYWFDEPTGGNLLTPNGAPTYTPSAAVSATYYAEARAGNCISDSRTPVTLTVNPLPALAAGTPVCSPDLDFWSVGISTNPDAMLTHNVGMLTPGGGGMYTLSNVAVGSNAFLTATLSATGCISTLNIVSPDCPCPVVNPPVSQGDRRICEGDAPDALSVTVSQGQTADWYDASGQLLQEDALSYTPSMGGVYFAETRDLLTGCVSATRTAVALFVDPKPVVAVQSTSCAPNLLTYSLLIDAPGATLSSTAGTVSDNGNPYTVSGIPKGLTVTLTATDTLYGCIQVLSVPAPPCECPSIDKPQAVNANPSVCVGQPLPPLSVTVGMHQTANWFNAVGQPVATGVTSYTPIEAGLYRVEAQDTINNCRSAERTDILLTVNALPTLIVADKVCAPDLLTYTLLVTSNATQLVSSLGSVNGAAGSFTVSGIPDGANVTLTAINQQTTCVSQLPVASPDCDCPVVQAPQAGSNQSVCAGQPFPALSAVPGSGETVDWYNSAGLLLAASMPSFVPPAPGTYYAEARNTTNGCVSATRTAVSLSLIPLPAIVLADTVCSPDLLSYSLLVVSDSSAVTAPPYAVLPLGGGNFLIQNIAVGSTVTVVAQRVGTTCAAQLTVQVNQCPCPTVNPPVSLGDRVMCQGDPIPTLGVTVGNPTLETVVWYAQQTGGLPIIPNGINTLNFQPSQATQTQTYWAQTLNTQSQCISAVRTPVTLTVNTRPVVQVGVDTTVCAGQPLQLNGMIIGAGGGAWSSNAGGIFLPNAGALSALTYTPPPGVEEVILTLTSENPPGPCPAVSDDLLLTVLPVPTLDLDTAICAPDLATYRLVFGSNTGSLSVSTGTLGSIGPNLYEVSGVPAGVPVVVTATFDATACSRSATFAPPICACTPPPPPQAPATLSYCAGDAIPTILATTPATQSVNWYDVAAGGSPILSGQNSFAPPGPGVYFAEAVDTLTECASATRTQVLVTEKPLPTAQAGADQAICTGASTTLDATTGAGYTYLWSTGEATPTITTTPVQTLSTYILTVTLDGCSDSDTVQVELWPLPSAGITLLDTIDCFGDSTATLLAAASGGAGSGYTFSWSNGASAAQIENLPAGLYSVTVEDENDCVATAGYSIGQPAALSQDSVRIQDILLGQSMGSIAVYISGGVPPYTYVWSSNGVPLPGQNTGLLDSIPAGTYTLNVADVNGCALAPDTFTVMAAGALSPDWSAYCRVFPNPTTGWVTVQLELPEAGIVLISLVDALGRTVLRTPPGPAIQSGALELDLSPYPAGMYLLRIQFDRASAVKKISLNK